MHNNSPKFQGESQLHSTLYRSLIVTLYKAHCAFKRLTLLIVKVVICAWIIEEVEVNGPKGLKMMDT